jgi:Holliday junction resolvase
MGKMSREKGKAGEREFAALCREHGYEAQRTAQNRGKTGEAGDVEGLPGIHVEVKRKEKFNLYEALEQAQRDAAAGERGMPIVAHRRNGKPWVIVMAAEDWFRLYTAAEEGL